MIDKQRLETMTAEEKQQIMAEINFCFVGIHATLKAVKYYSQYIKEYMAVIHDLSTKEQKKKVIKKMKMLKDNFNSIDTIIFLFDKAVKNDPNIDQDIKEEHEEFSYKLMEHLQEQAFAFVNKEIGAEVVVENNL